MTEITSDVNLYSLLNASWDLYIMYIYTYVPTNFIVCGLTMIHNVFANISILMKISKQEYIIPCINNLIKISKCSLLFRQLQ